MKAKEMRDKTPEELGKLLAEWREELFRLNIRSMTGQIEKASRTGTIKKDIARALTVLGEQVGGSEVSERGSDAS